MKRVWLKSPADLDYLQALEWYEERRPGLGQEFDAELLALFERIKRNPELFQKETSVVRKARMPRFKYRIYFAVEGDEIGVLAIWHPSRNPEALRQRLK
ncbi:MAG: type II toxin-antitoxin system RelE/ParE family toxin [Verrucomicrobiota bacterium]|jgi:plasmid stabilization system protein ParE